MKKLLGKKTFGYYVRLTLLTPFWVLSTERTSWENFKSRMIKHKCEYEDVPYEIIRGKLDNTHWHRCKHFGCNTVEPKHYLTADGLDLEKWRYEKFQNKFNTFEDYLNDSIFENRIEPLFKNVETIHES